MSRQSNKKTALETGERIRNRYIVEGEIGQGGFARVYSARDEIIDRIVAVKVLDVQGFGSDDDDQQRARKRFLREARVAARIGHSSVVDIYDFGLLDSTGAPFIVMEFLDGDNLYNQIYGRGPLAPSWLLPNYCQVLDALGEAHREDIIHKDLKPGNIFLNRPGTRREVWKVVDFGIAHINSSTNARLTKKGFLSGTPQYLPPEYIQAQTVSTQMDVYQMGLTLVEALTGQPAVSERKPFKAAMKHIQGDLDVPQNLQQSPLGPVLARALATKQSDRYPTAMEFADALDEVDPASVPSASKEDKEEEQTGGTQKWAAVTKEDAPQ